MIVDEAQIELLREWIMAEVDFAIDYHEEVNHGGDCHNSRQRLDNIFKKVVESGLATHE